VKTLKLTEANEISWFPIFFAFSTLFLLIIYIHTRNISQKNLENGEDNNISIDIWNIIEEFVKKYLQ
jgi:hypothetical protein